MNYQVVGLGFALGLLTASGLFTVWGTREQALGAAVLGLVALVVTAFLPYPKRNLPRA